MKRALMIAAVAMIGFTHHLMAADDGQTQPRLNYAGNSSWSTYVDLVPTTNGSGNVKGVHCLLEGVPAVVRFTVDGGTAQDVTIDSSYMPSDASVQFSGWVPFNIRFASSIRIQIRKGSVAVGSVSCSASWALD